MPEYSFSVCVCVGGGGGVTLLGEDEGYVWSVIYAVYIVELNHDVSPNVIHTHVLC